MGEERGTEGRRGNDEHLGVAQGAVVTADPTHKKLVGARELLLPNLKLGGEQPYFCKCKRLVRNEVETRLVDGPRSVIVLNNSRHATPRNAEGHFEAWAAQPHRCADRQVDRYTQTQTGTERERERELHRHRHRHTDTQHHHQNYFSSLHGPLPRAPRRRRSRSRGKCTGASISSL